MILSSLHHTTSYRLTDDQQAYLFLLKSNSCPELGAYRFFAYNLRQVLFGFHL